MLKKRGIKAYERREGRTRKERRKLGKEKGKRGNGMDTSRSRERVNGEEKRHSK